jgi:hypothetical protein
MHIGRILFTDDRALDDEPAPLDIEDPQPHDATAEGDGEREASPAMAYTR